MSKVSQKELSRPKGIWFFSNGTGIVFWQFYARAKGCVGICAEVLIFPFVLANIYSIQYGSCISA